MADVSCIRVCNYNETIKTTRPLVSVVIVFSTQRYVQSGTLVPTRNSFIHFGFMLKNCGANVQRDHGCTVPEAVFRVGGFQNLASVLTFSVLHSNFNQGCQVGTLNAKSQKFGLFKIGLKCTSVFGMFVAFLSVLAESKTFLAFLKNLSALSLPF